MVAERDVLGRVGHLYHRAVAVGEVAQCVHHLLYAAVSRGVSEEREDVPDRSQFSLLLLTSVVGVRGGATAPNHHGLVPNKCFQLRERPGMDSALRLGLAPRLRALPNVLEVFQYDRRSWLHRPNDLLGEHMIAVTAEAGLLVAYATQVAFGRPAALLLQRPFEVKQPPLSRLPRLLAQEVVLGCDGGASESQIHADDLLGGGNLRGWRAHHHM